MTGEVDLGIDGLSDYQVVGTGGFSTVYSARDEGFNRRVAVKLLHSLDESGRRRFDRERGIMGQLGSHPNVITPYRAGYTHTGAPYLVMEYVEGGSLFDLVRAKGALPWTEAVDLVLSATAALSHAHEQGVLHRDVKPANILLAGSIPKLTDFGIAAIRESTASQVAFTLAHCPPETFSHGRDSRDERSDLYSMASTLFTLAVGHPPFDVDGEDSQQAYMFRIIGHQVPDPPHHLVPGPLRDFMKRALAKDPTERPQSAAEFQTQLRQIRSGHLAGQQTIAAPEPLLTPQPPLPPVHPDDITNNQASGTSTDHGTLAATGLVPAPVGSPGMVDDPVGPPPHQSTEEQGLAGRPTKQRRLPLVAVAAGIVAVVAIAAVAWLVFGQGRAEGEPPEVAWRFETNSSLASKPAVGDNTLVIGAAATNMVHAVNTENGEERWSFLTNGAVSVGAAITDGSAFIGSADGRMYAFALDNGDLLWRQGLGAPVTSGALVEGDLVIASTFGGQVWALDRASGSPVWSADTDPINEDTNNPVINSTPALATVGGQEVIVVGTTRGGLFLIHPESGDVIERIALEGGVWFSSPLVIDRPDGQGQEVWIGTSLGQGGFLNRIDLESAEIRMFSTSMGVGTNPAITNDGAIVAGNDAGELFAVDQITMGELWREGYADTTQIKGSPVVFEDEIIFGTHDKELISVDDLDGIERWRFKGDQIFGLSAPIVIGDKLFVGNDSGTVYRFDL